MHMGCTTQRAVEFWHVRVGGSADAAPGLQESFLGVGGNIGITENRMETTIMGYMG